MTEQEFDELSASGKRVAIMQDVLEALEKKKIIPRRGVYVNVRDEKWSGTEIDMKSHLDELEEPCVTCMMGACLISYVRFKNNVTFNEMDFLTSSRQVWDGLKDLFSNEQLALMEYAFECSHPGTRVGKFDENQTFAEVKKKITNAVDWGRNFNRWPVNEEGIMKAIAENVIANNGEFII